MRVNLVYKYTMKKILLIFLFFSVVLMTKAVPAYPEKVNFIQPNGEQVTVFMQGDEFVKFARSEDDYTLLYDQDGFLNYAMLNQDGDLIPSLFHAHNISERSREEIEFLQTISPNLFFSQAQLNSLLALREAFDQQLEAAPKPSTTGNMRLICILMGFQDKPFLKTNQDFQNLLNQVGYNSGGASGSLHDYYNEASYGQLKITFDVLGPYTANYTADYYGSNVYGNARALANEAINQAAPFVDFSDYDNDGDGNIDGLYIIFAGNGEEAGGGANAIWSHAGWIDRYIDGVQIDRYACSPEFRGANSTSITHIGVICHELGHVLGAPDYYDTNYEEGGLYDGTGTWDLMAQGSWNGGGSKPAHPNPRIKVYTYNWADIITLNSSQNVLLPPSIHYKNGFYRINTNTNGEYFLLENRSQRGFDGGVPGNGMVIYRCAANVSQGPINTTHRQKFYPVAANSTFSLPSPGEYGSINAASTPWPGTLNKVIFNDTTFPSMKAWNTQYTEKPISNIAYDNQNYLISFEFMGGGNLASHRVFLPQRPGVSFDATPASSNPVPDGDDFSFTVSVDQEYDATNIVVIVDGDTIIPTNQVYTLTNVTSPKMVEVYNVKIKTFEITATSGVNGSISPTGITTVPYNGTVTFSANPTVGYGVAEMFVDSVSVGALQKYTFSNVLEPHSIHVEFEMGDPDLISSSLETLHFVTHVNTPSIPQTTIVNADPNQLSINILAKAPPHFQISLNGGSWVTQLVIQKSDLPKALFVRFNPSDVGIVEDTLRLLSIGAHTRIPVKGEALSSVQEIEFASLFKVVPNPASNHCDLIIDHSQAIQFPIQLSVFNAVGQLIHHVQIEDYSTTIDISEWSSGLYYLRLVGSNTHLKTTQKLLKL